MNAHTPDTPPNMRFGCVGAFQARHTNRSALLLDFRLHIQQHQQRTLVSVECAI